MKVAEKIKHISYQIYVSILRHLQENYMKYGTARLIKKILT